VRERLLQLVQAPPFEPQLCSDEAVQVAPLQQPLGHEVASHTQAPPTQRCPLVHTWPLVPHTHAPPAHRSAVAGSHAEHTEPFAPHASTDGELQLLPLQQPFGHESALQPLHAPAAQLCPLAQVWHAAPPEPQAIGVGARQTSPAQQPFGHDMPSQMQTPLAQCWPAAHGAPPPQLQAPAVQPSAAIASQARQVLPAAPHALTDGARQAEPLQQPVVQVAGLQPLQAPAMHA
jgi:hypothetical protein